MNLNVGPGTWCFSNFSRYSKPLIDQKCHAEQHGNDEVADQHFALARLRRFHRQHNRNRTDDQDGGISGSQRDAELLASSREGVEVGEAVDR